MHAKLENHVWSRYEQLSRASQIEQQPVVESDTRFYLRTKKIRDFALLSYFIHSLASPTVSGLLLLDFPSGRSLLVWEDWAESRFGFCSAATHSSQSWVLLGQGPWWSCNIYLHTSPWLSAFWCQKVSWLPGSSLQTGFSFQSPFLFLKHLLLLMNISFWPSLLFSAPIPLFSKSK